MKILKATRKNIMLYEALYIYCLRNNIPYQFDSAADMYLSSDTINIDDICKDLRMFRRIKDYKLSYITESEYDAVYDYFTYDEYMEYMKSVTDAFVKILSYVGSESIIASDSKVSVSIYRYTEYLLEFNTELKHMYRNESYGSRLNEYNIKKQEIANQFLFDNKLTYDEWLTLKY